MPKPTRTPERIKLPGGWRLEMVEGRYRLFHTAYNGHTATFATEMEAHAFATAMNGKLSHAQTLEDIKRKEKLSLRLINAVDRRRLPEITAMSFKVWADTIIDGKLYKSGEAIQLLPPAPTGEE